MLFDVVRLLQDRRLRAFTIYEAASRDYPPTRYEPDRRRFARCPIIGDQRLKTLVWHDERLGPRVDVEEYRECGGPV